jgi:hypothetical protein
MCQKLNCGIVVHDGLCAFCTLCANCEDMPRFHSVTYSTERLDMPKKINPRILICYPIWCVLVKNLSRNTCPHLCLQKLNYDVSVIAALYVKFHYFAVSY